MIKSVCFGIGLFLLLVGLSLAGIDSYVVKPSKTAQATNIFYGPMQAEAKTVTPEPWKPWAYIAAGVVLCLWTCTLPEKLKGK